MPCGSCAAARNRGTYTYIWTPPEGSDEQPIQYNMEVQAKAKVIRSGGTWERVPNPNA